MAQWRIEISGSGDVHQEATAEKACADVVKLLKENGCVVESATFVHAPREEERIDKLAEEPQR